MLLLSNPHPNRSANRINAKFVGVCVCACEHLRLMATKSKEIETNEFKVNKTLLSGTNIINHNTLTERDLNSH